jgi:Flp pilus assembly protein TadG
MTARPHRSKVSSRNDGRPGQAVVEFAFAGTVFLLIVLGTIDFGRAIFISAQLHNAVREGTRYSIVHPTDIPGVKSAVVAQAVGTGLTTAGVTATCGASTCTVSASVSFSAVTQSFLGIPALTLQSTSTAQIE